MSDENNIYLDNSSTTRLDERVLEEMKPYFFNTYAVASSEFGYSLGIKAKKDLNKARKRLAKRISADQNEFIFTSGATESSNLALKGVVNQIDSDQKNHIIVSEIEDFPVLNSAKTLEKQGYDVTFLEVDKEGFVNLDRLEEEIKAETILVSIQHANQEIGTIQNIEKIGQICKSEDVIFHTDATHTFTRIPIDVHKYNIDLMTVSAHTINGPRGIGGLYISQDTPYKKWIDGGYQEFNKRAGVVNIPGAIGFAKAAELVTEEENDRLKDLRDYLIDRVLSEIEDTTLNGPKEDRLPQNANVTFHFVEGESITLHLDMRGFSVSTGSACFSNSLEASHVIMGIGGDHERAHGSVRFSFSRYNDKEDVDKVISEIGEVVEQLREISPLSE